MTIPLHPTWRFEPCDPEGAIDYSTNTPYPHAVRGVRPSRVGQARITGYGGTETDARESAERRARTYDAQEQLGMLPQHAPLPPEQIA